MPGPFDSGLGDMFGGAGVPRSSPAPAKEEKGVPWHAKVIDGKYYVPLSEVAELLKTNGVLPKVLKGVERRVGEEPIK